MTVELVEKFIVNCWIFYPKTRNYFSTRASNFFEKGLTGH